MNQSLEDLTSQLTPKTHSKRALAFFEKSKRHFNINFSPKTKRQIHPWVWSIVLEGDKILTLDYQLEDLKSLKAEDLLFCESISMLALKKNLFDLKRLTFRECENFLRDENHLPAFENESEGEFKRSFERILNSLIAAIILEISLKNDNERRLLHWEKLTLVEKNRLISSLLKSLSLQLHLAKPIELALAEKSIITIIKNDFPYDLQVLDEIVRAQIYQENEESLLKVVAAL